MRNHNWFLLAALVALGFVAAGCENGNGDEEAGTGTTETPATFIVTFNADGGTVSPARATVEEGGTVRSLPVVIRGGYAFGGWYTAKGGGGLAFTTATRVSADITVYAKWTRVVDVSIEVGDRASLEKAAADAAGKKALITVTGSFTAAAITLGTAGTHITLRGDGADRTITYAGNLFTLGSAVSLTLESGVTFSGGRVSVEGGAFIMEGGTITGNHDGEGAAVYVSGGTFTMWDGTISGNIAAARGGGVCVGGGKQRNLTAGPGVNLNSGTSANWD